MSDTPRTDALLIETRGMAGPTIQLERERVVWEHARRLERELNKPVGGGWNAAIETAAKACERIADLATGDRECSAADHCARVVRTLMRHAGPSVPVEPSDAVLVRMIGAWFEDERAVCDDEEFLRRMRLAYKAINGTPATTSPIEKEKP